MAVCLLQCEKEPAQKMVRTLMGQGRVLHAPGIPDVLVQDDSAGIYISPEDLTGFLNQDIRSAEAEEVFSKSPVLRKRTVQPGQTHFPDPVLRVQGSIFIQGVRKIDGADKAAKMFVILCCHDWKQIFIDRKV